MSLAKMLPRERQLLPIYEDLRCEVSPDRQGWAETARTIGKHLIAMADELEGAKKGEDKCSYCGGPVDVVDGAWCWSNHKHLLYCSKGCVEMAGMEPDARTIRIHGRPDAISIPELADAVIKRLRDYHGLGV